MSEPLQDYIVLTHNSLSYKEADGRLEVFDTQVFAPDYRSVGELSFEFVSQDLVSIELIVDAPRLAEELIRHLKFILGPAMTLKIRQTGRDSRFSGCPYCGGTDFQWKSERGTYVVCGDHFEVDLREWAESLAVSAGFFIGEEEGWNFEVVYSYLTPFQNELKKVIFAEVQIRPSEAQTVVAVCPVAQEFSVEFAFLLQTLQTMKLENLKVMKIKRRPNAQKA